LVYFDINATNEQQPPDYAFIDDFADECFMPLTIGGGVKSIEHVGRLLKVGADKVAINTAAVENIVLIREAANKYGSQCIVVAIDVKNHNNGKYEIYTHSGTKPTGKDPVLFAQEVERQGAGEIILTSIDRDGTMLGYDEDLTRMVSDAVSIPVIASGGAGNYQHMVDVIIKGKATAVAAASIYHFTQQTPLEAKKYMAQHGIHVRL